jgi:hypothetical protein
MSDTQYANEVNSGIAGFYDRYPRIPYLREAAFTEGNRQKFDNAIPFFKKISDNFKELMPNRYSVQASMCEKLDPRYVVEGTVFTTLTVNRNFRTAYHRDAGDLTEGFSNLTVISNGKAYSGGMLVLPEYRVAVDIRPGDLLLINNHEGIHGNTELVYDEEGAERMSFVCYFREGMLDGGSKEYEDLRRKFVESNKHDTTLKYWRPGFNGVFEGMFSSERWRDFLLGNGGSEFIEKYHPDLSTNRISVESFFGDD